MGMDCGEFCCSIRHVLDRVFVTCFYAILDPKSGQMRYANAGHELPYRRYNGGVSELWVTGMPLGMMPGSRYEEQEITLAPGGYNPLLVQTIHYMKLGFAY